MPTLLEVVNMCQALHAIHTRFYSRLPTSQCLRTTSHRGIRLCGFHTLSKVTLLQRGSIGTSPPMPGSMLDLDKAASPRRYLNISFWT